MTHVSVGPGLDGLTELSWCGKAQKGSVGDERGEAGRKGGRAAVSQPGLFGRTGSYFWRVMNLLPPAMAMGQLRKAVRACCLFIVVPSFFWEAGTGLQK